MPRRVYWDSCTFLGLINQEPGKASDCAAVWKEAQQEQTVIYTSFFAFVEVFKAKCEGQQKPLSEADDLKVVQLLQQKFIRTVLLDERTALLARRLLRAHPECKKPTDGIHLASALILSVDEMHTTDHADLLGLDGKVMKEDGTMLKICVPKPLPPPPIAPDLLTGL